MATSHDSRIFHSGTASTLFVTIPARVVAASQFPFEADDAVTVSIDDAHPVITATGKETYE
jgi:pyruvate/2-oxoglutarate/acetoin dehydrogenase E1 component